jgi:tRNA pseudouridine38-40 synthase
MPRYFLALSYKGTAYRGFQLQQNAHTVQAEVEKALAILVPGVMELTGSSRTDAGVHARKNYFHFDIPEKVETYRGINSNEQLLYKLNAVLPADIAVLSLHSVPDTAHCRFDAVQRDYRYYIYRKKDPFLRDRAYYFPYRLQEDLLQEAAGMLREYNDFTSFSKRNTQVKTFICSIVQSKWTREGDLLIYEVAGNRFLRGMVRALTATMLRVGRGVISLDQFREIIESRDCTRASFAVPPNGLFLEAVRYPQGYFD